MHGGIPERQSGHTCPPGRAVKRGEMRGSTLRARGVYGCWERHIRARQCPGLRHDFTRADNEQCPLLSVRSRGSFARLRPFPCRLPTAPLDFQDPHCASPLPFGEPLDISPRTSPGGEWAGFMLRHTPVYHGRLAAGRGVGKQKTSGSGHPDPCGRFARRRGYGPSFSGFGLPLPVAS